MNDKYTQLETVGREWHCCNGPKLCLEKSGILQRHSDLFGDIKSEGTA